MARKQYDVFDALADSTRRRILELLRGRELPAGQIARHFTLQRPGISKHLTILKEAGLLVERRDRQRRLYRIRVDTLEAAIERLRILRPTRSNESQGPSPGVLESVRAAAVDVEPVRPRRFVPRFELEFD